MEYKQNIDCLQDLANKIACLDRYGKMHIKMQNIFAYWWPSYNNFNNFLMLSRCHCWSP